MADIYVIDTCSLLDLEARRPRRRYGCLWGRLDGLVDEGRLKAPYSVYNEILPSNAPLYTWAKKMARRSGNRRGTAPATAEPGLFVHDVILWKDVYGITKRHGDLVGPCEAGMAADPFVISLALSVNDSKAGRAIIVTEEGGAEGGIPHVASAYGIRTVGLSEFLRMIGVRAGRLPERRGGRGGRKRKARARA